MPQRVQGKKDKSFGNKGKRLKTNINIFGRSKRSREKFVLFIQKLGIILVFLLLNKIQFSRKKGNCVTKQVRPRINTLIPYDNKFYANYFR